MGKRYDDLGYLLHKNWELKKKLATQITTSQIDEMYERACEAGALGGKIAGAGGGGFLLLYCPQEKQNAVRRALEGYREMPFLLEADGSKVIFNYRRYGWR
jgi:D-glycero-alpha-D-manno-heptose-7-phosphate kinase